MRILHPQIIITLNTVKSAVHLFILIYEISIRVQLPPRQLEHDTPVDTLLQIQFCDFCPDSGVVFFAPAGPCSFFLFFFGFYDGLHFLFGVQVEIILLELVDKPALMTRHGQFVGKVG